MAADNYEIDVTLDQIFGTGISSVEQTVESHEPNGVNEITVTLTNGQTSVFNVRNGDSSGKPTPVATVAEMTDTSEIYLYTGNEEGYVKGNIYCYEGGEWTDVGTYGGMIVDEALDADSENAVTNKAITSAIQTLNNKVNSKPDVASGGNKTIIIGEVDQDPPSGVYVPTVGLTGALSSLTTTNKNSLTGAINEVKADVNALIAAVGSPLVANTAAGMTDQTKIYVYTGSETGYTSGHWYYYDGSAWADGGIYQSTGIDTDKTLTVANQAADAKKTGDEISDLKSAIRRESGISEEIKQALMAAFNHVTWDDDDPSGQTYIDALEDALYPPTNLTSISAVYTQSGVVSTMDTLDSLRSDLVVTAHYDDLSTETILNYALSGQLTLGTSTITVSYSGKSTTFNVNVTQEIPSEYTQMGYITSAVHGTPSEADLDTTPYINLNFPSSDLDILHYTVTADFMCVFNTVTPAIFGGKNTDANNSTKGIQILLGATDTVALYGQTTSTGTLIRSATGSGLSLNQRHTIQFKDGNISVDGAVAVQTNANYAIQSSQHKWRLFARIMDGLTTTASKAPMIGNVYGFSIKDASNNYVMNLIPAKRNSDDVYGMYDTVTEAFYTSAIPTGFSGGN